MASSLGTADGVRSADGVGPATRLIAGQITHPISGQTYRISREGDGPWLTTRSAAGGQRRQRIVGRLGAGLFDTSWVTAEANPWTGEDLGRLFFAPVETIANHGLELSPFDLEGGSAGPDMALTEDCFGCHTQTPAWTLPGAATGAGLREVYPRNALGRDAFEHLQPLGCEACHSSAEEHLRRVAGEAPYAAGNPGLARLGQLSPPAQLDVCARCHLQGDVRFQLAETIDAETPLGVQWPVLITAQGEEDFRFVGQLERLVESPCFQGSPAMTCTTCHEPHTSSRVQPLADFDRACAQCHTFCSRSQDLAVEAVTGQAARSSAGCVDCHLRRSQPFDLPHVRTADHWIRRRIPKPRDDVPYRQLAAAQGRLRLFPDSRLEPFWRTPAGERWRQGVLAMGETYRGRYAAAVELVRQAPPPGSAAARVSKVPAGWVALEQEPAFHELRAVALQGTGDLPGALRALEDTLAVAPGRPGPLLLRASLRSAVGDLQGAVADSGEVIRHFPRAEGPWELRATLALASGQEQLAAGALQEAVAIWPSKARLWWQLALLWEQLGRPQEAAAARERGRFLEPSLEHPSP
jgi:hypothetical protein